MNPLSESAMHHIQADGFGGPGVLKLVSGPRPRPGTSEVLIRVQAAGVNRPDVAQRQGLYPPPPDASPLLGLEVAGEVVSVGEAVCEWRTGDRVCALTHGGGYAEYVTAPAAHCLPWPRGYDAVRAAALPETYFTVWANVFQMGRLARGESLLVHGGSSGIGVTAIQLAREFAGAVYVTAGSQEKCAACLRLGATASIAYREQDFVERVRELTGGAGVDVVLDMVGAPYLARNLRTLALDGRLIQIATQHGAKADGVDLVQIMRKRLTITGSMLRPRTIGEKAAIAAALRAMVWPVLDAGRCAPVIHRVLPLEQAAEAHREMEAGAHIGKLVLRVADD